MGITIRSDDPKFYEILAIIQDSKPVEEAPVASVAHAEVQAMTQDKLRAFCSDAIKQGKQQQLRDILNELGVKNLTELDEKDYETVVQALL